MKKKFFLLIAVTLTSYTVESQVNIGSLDAPHRGAVLQLSTDSLGIKLPTVFLNDLEKLGLGDDLTADLASDPTAEGMIVFNTNPDVGIGSAIYVWTGEIWKPLWSEKRVKYQLVSAPRKASAPKTEFCFTDISLPISDEQTNLTINLYDEYVKLMLPDDHAQHASSNGESACPLTLYAANELDYYVTVAAGKMRINSISPEGVMNYDLTTSDAEGVVIHLLCVVK
ncbi:MAG: hypothetical protein LBR66_08230 [Candidatus Symbiothrix sp.]|jgi:hypothetical protein|nr:hypothetical protein [Candidatus Symbiothrix sp.]